MKNTKNSTRTLTVLALLIAMSIVFSWVLSISTGFVRFNLGSLPVLLAGIVFGPGAGFAVGALADMIGGILAGYAINPLITLGAASICLTPCDWASGSCSVWWRPMWWALSSSTRWRSTFFMATPGACWQPVSPTH